jgi:glycosyltransferase involved in cell wall biosynthesis
VSQGCNIPKSSISNEQRAMLRKAVTKDGKKIVTHFGYIGEHKNVHKLFELLDPSKYFIQLLCELHEERKYDQKIMKYIRSDEWRDSVNVSGYLPSKDVADYLSISDAVVFLFKGGVQLANTSYLAALNQGVFVIASSTTSAGFNEAYNTYFLNLQELDILPEILRDEHEKKELDITIKNWSEIAREHIQVYTEIVTNAE